MAHSGRAGYAASLSRAALEAKMFAVAVLSSHRRARTAVKFGASDRVHGKHFKHSNLPAGWAVPEKQAQCHVAASYPPLGNCKWEQRR